MIRCNHTNRSYRARSGGVSLLLVFVYAVHIICLMVSVSAIIELGLIEMGIAAIVDLMLRRVVLMVVCVNSLLLVRVLVLGLVIFFA